MNEMAPPTALFCNRSVYSFYNRFSEVFAEKSTSKSWKSDKECMS